MIFDYTFNAPYTKEEADGICKEEPAKRFSFTDDNGGHHYIRFGDGNIIFDGEEYRVCTAGYTENRITQLERDVNNTVREGQLIRLMIASLGFNILMTMMVVVKLFCK